MDQVKDIVDSVILKLLKKDSPQSKNIENIWQKAAGKKIQQHTKLAGLKQDQLVVYVDSPAWLYQLNLLKNKMLKEIQGQIPEIKRIHFKTGKVL
jgi:predicted nucleic acid-binding Zn ribbon protein